MTDYEDELEYSDGEAHCPHPACDWWVPAGMEYLYLPHREEHDFH